MAHELNHNFAYVSQITNIEISVHETLFYSYVNIVHIQLCKAGYLTLTLSLSYFFLLHLSVDQLWANLEGENVGYYGIVAYSIVWHLRYSQGMLLVLHVVTPPKHTTHYVDNWTQYTRSYLFLCDTAFSPPPFTPRFGIGEIGERVKRVEWESGQDRIQQQMYYDKQMLGWVHGVYNTSTKAWWTKYQRVCV